MSHAGDAGTGFAVVGGEVKGVAQETAKATENISRRVQAINADTDSAVTAMANISAIVERIRGQTTSRHPAGSRTAAGRSLLSHGRREPAGDPHP
jgi:methyl-accepting chemotaxis protein